MIGVYVPVRRWSHQQFPQVFMDIREKTPPMPPGIPSGVIRRARLLPFTVEVTGKGKEASGDR